MGMKAVSAVPGTEQTHVAARGSSLVCFRKGWKGSHHSSGSRHGGRGRPRLLREPRPPPSSCPQAGREATAPCSCCRCVGVSNTPFCANTSPLPWREAPSSIQSDSHHLAGTRASAAQGQMTSATMSQALQAPWLPGRRAARRLLLSLAAPPKGAR